MLENRGGKAVEEMHTEIAFRHLAAYVLKRWRLWFLAVLACVAGALLLASMQWVTAATVVENPVADAQGFSETEEILSENRDILELIISNIENELEYQYRYNRDSLLMQMDPYHKEVYTLAYAIGMGDSALAQEQDASLVNSLLKRYLLYFGNGEFYSLCLERVPDIKDVRYLQEIFAASMDENANILVITVISGDDATGQAMLDAVRDGLAAANAQAAQVYGAHELREIVSNSYTVKDTALADRQQKNYQAILTLTAQLRSKNAELAALGAEPTPSGQPPARGSLSKRLLYVAAVAFFASLMLTALVLATYYLVSNRVIDGQKLRYASGLAVLGSVPRAKAKKARLMDRAAAAIGRVRLYTGQRDSALALTARSIYTAAMAKGAAERGIALAGSLPEPELADIAGAFNKAVPEARLPFTAVGNPMLDIASVDKTTAAGVVVIVVKQGVSLCSDVQIEAARIRDWGMPVLGAVLLNADTV